MILVTPIEDDVTRVTVYLYDCVCELHRGYALVHFDSDLSVHFQLIFGAQCKWTLNRFTVI